MKKREVEQIYPLSPMQEGMLFHAICEPESRAYFEQASFHVSGSFQPELFARAWNELMRRHAILRTAFVYKSHSRPLQVVLKEREIPVTIHETNGLSETQVRRLVENHATKDRKRGFDLAKESLTRITIFRVNERSHHIIWSHHHILTDGWCNTIILRELSEIYDSLCRGKRPPDWPAPPPYHLYIQWLEKQDRKEAIAYWTACLSGFEQRTPLAPFRSQRSRSCMLDPDYRLSERFFTIGREETAALKRLAIANKVTMSTLFKLIWGVLLSRYNNTRDVVFGEIVSGRPSEIQGVENMIGLFINAQPVRIRIRREAAFSEVLKEVQKNALEGRERQHTPLATIQTECTGLRELFDHLFVFENYPMDDGSLQAGSSLEIEDMKAYEQTHYDFTVVVVPGDDIHVRFSFNESVHPVGEIKRVVDHFETAIQSVLDNPAGRIADIHILPESERDRILYGFNDSASDYPAEATIAELFEHQTALRPDNMAVAFEGRTLTYRELNERANALARFLLERCDIRPEEFVGVLMDRSEWVPAALLAILKAGAAYMPIDPAYPRRRVAYILEDSSCRVVISDEKHGPGLSDFPGVEVIDAAAAGVGPASNPRRRGDGDGLAYVIYTSGSTGRPKGSLIEHRSVARLVKNTNYIHLDETIGILQTGSLAFDASTFEIWGALLNGGRLYLPPEQAFLDTEKAGELIGSRRITTMWLTSSLFNQLVDENAEIFKGLRHLLVGGEKLSPRHINKVRKAHPGLHVINGYGPTENTTFTACYAIEREFEHDIPIGAPISNTRVYILSRNGDPAPIGAPGEICIGGGGLARGYLNRPELTKEKFVENPFEPGQRMYRTGDVGRFLPDGVIEFLGRIDDQVKIRGFRIELEEIQSRLLRFEEIREAALVAKDFRGNGRMELAAYVVGVETLNDMMLRKRLKETLPDYMIPSYFVQMEKIPLTPNGKTDKNALPDPLGAAMAPGADYEAPRNEIEGVVAAVWADVLGREAVGVHDNYFSLGGDSIKAIQVVSRLRQKGLRIKIKDLFLHPAIADLASRVVQERMVSENDDATGEIPLTAIQKWFFRESIPERYHFNQAVMLKGRPFFDENAVREALKAMYTCHDALRITFRAPDNGDAVSSHRGEEESSSETGAGPHVIQKCPDDIPPLHFEVIDLRNVRHGRVEMEASATALQAGLDLERGRLMQTALYHLDDGDRLLIAIHHLVVDGVSWRILLEDLDAAYDRILKNQSVQLPPKTTSFKSWAEKIREYSESEALKRETDLWKGVLERTRNFSLPHEASADDHGAVQTGAAFIELSEEETGALLGDAHQAYNTRVDDLLLTAIARAFATVTGSRRLPVVMEGHGRESVIEEVDVSRTVGWFTCVYPVVLEAPETDNPGRWIKETKKNLREIPNKGVGYGILKYITPDVLLPRDDHLPLSYNYLGQFDESEKAKHFSVAEESAGESVSPLYRSRQTLRISGIVLDKRLRLTFAHGGAQWKESTIRALLDECHETLRDLCRHCLGRETNEKTPGDFIYAFPRLDDYDHLLTTHGWHSSDIEDVHPLSPMQEGLLFQSLYEPGSRAYFDQFSWRLSGSLNIDSFVKSFRLLVDRHHILRTAFVHDGAPCPLQVVLKTGNLSVVVEDVASLAPEDQNHRIEEYRSDDRARGFDMTSAPQMRIAIFSLAPSGALHQFVWSFHHILMDGWCIGVLFRELMQIYNCLRRGETPVLPTPPPYRDYIRWLETRNRDEDKAYWTAYLSGCEQGVSLAGFRTPRSENEVSDYRPGELSFTLDKNATGSLNRLAAECGATLNNVLRLAWAVLLSRYNHTPDVVFGAIVSGRPSEVAGIEEMVGLFINAVPVRIRVEPGRTFPGVLDVIQKESAEGEMHHYTPLAEIQADCSDARELFDHLFVFENYPLDVESIRFDGSIMLDDGDAFEHTHYDFNLVILPGEEIHVKFNFNGNSFAVGEIERIAGHFKTLIRRILNNPETKIDDIDILPERERSQVLHLFNDTATAYPENKTIVDLFEEQVEKRPGAAAVLFEESAVSYRELNERANGIARFLKEELDVAPEEPVGVLTDRSPLSIAALMGILKAGGAYMPVDPVYPRERIEYILENSGSKALLTEKKYLEKTDALPGVRVVDAVAVVGPVRENPPPAAAPDSLAYIIYTSGSTGKPKGCMIEHRGFVNMSLAQIESFGVSGSDRVLQFASSSFDASLSEIFMALFAGASLVIVSRERIEAPDNFANHLADKKVTVATLPPAYLNMLEPSALSTVNALITAGEPAIVKDALFYSRGKRYFNAYGPSETSVCASIHEVDPDGEYGARIPIGKPIANTAIYILDDSLQPAPMGIPGEICVAGAGVGRGYLHNPELTKKSFIPSPFQENVRLYRTGDMGRHLPDGSVEFSGRNDDQVKVRGFRIEPGEIENALSRCDGVKEAVLLARDNKADGNKELIAYVVVDGEMRADDIDAQLRKRLPEYMIPSFLIPMKKMPLTPNGKIDKKALPAPAAGRFDHGAEYAAPRDEIERKLGRIWEKVLYVSNIGIRDNFFALGGHSLKAIRIVNLVHEELDAEISLQTFFGAPTISALAETIRKKDPSTFIPIEKTPEAAHFPVSHAQRRLWVLDKFEGGGAAYNMPAALALEGKLNPGALEQAFQTLSLRHESLRTVLITVDGKPVQKILDGMDFKVNFLDLTHESHPEKRAGEIAREDALSPFDLSKGPLIRVTLLKLEAGARGSEIPNPKSGTVSRRVLLFNMHHIVSDGWSMTILIREFRQLYEFFDSRLTTPDGQREFPLHPLRIQYKDYSAWQNRLLSEPAMSVHGDYWHKKLSGEITALDLPADFPRPALQTYNGGNVTFRVSSSMREGLNTLGKKRDASLFMTLLAVVNVLLHRYTGQEDIIVGSPIAGRSHADLEEQIGLYVNTLALRNRVHPKESFNIFLEKVKDTATEAYDHQIYPFDSLVEELDLSRDPSRSPLFDVMVDYQRDEGLRLSLPDLRILPFEMEVSVSKFYISFNFMEDDAGLACNIEYNTDLFLEDRIERMGAHFTTLLESLLENPDAPVGDLEMLPEEERRRLLTDFIDTHADSPRDRTIVDLFERWVDETPDNTAVILPGGGREESRLSYGALNRRANRIAHFLTDEWGVGPEDRVGLLLKRSPWMVAGAIGVLKSGGAYVPMDPDYPPKRLEYMIENSGCRVILSDDAILSDRLNIRTNTVDIETIEGEEGDPRLAIPGDRLAYVIYTSGSTGRPKGVMVEHRSLANLAHASRRAYGLHDLDIRLLQMASISFDVFTGDILRALTNGGQMIICPGDVRIDLPALYTLMARYRIDIFESTPALVLPLMDYIHENGLDVRFLKVLIMGSDSLQLKEYKKLCRRFGHAMRILNSYGVTEAAIDSSYYENYEPESTPGALTPIGGPLLQNTRFYVLDGGQKLSPIGVAGELYIGGEGVARGYWNREDLTAERFISHPIEPGALLYRTGDLARWLADGVMEFWGRGDNQAQIRGFRVEPGEVESSLSRHESVVRAVVTADDFRGHGYKELAAYVKSDEKLDVSALREFLKKTLPDYMIPSYFVQLAQIPLTPNDKIDRNAFPDPVKSGMDQGTPHQIPRGAAETALAAAWSEVLGREEIGVRENFFALGGDSIKAIQVISSLQEKGLKMELQDLFQYPTIAESAPRAASILSGRMQEAITGVVPMTAAQKWFFQTTEPGERHFNLAMMLKGNSSPDLFRGVDEVRFDEKALREAFKALQIHHDALRMTYETVDMGEGASENGKWMAPVDEEHGIVQRCVDTTQPLHFESVVLTGRDDALSKMETHANEMQAGIDLAKGPIMRAALYHLDDGDRLLIVIHHLGVDVVSFRILLEDLNTAYEQILGGRPVELPSKTTSLKTWGEKIHAYSERKTLKNQIDYWRRVLEMSNEFSPPHDYEGGDSIIRCAKNASVSLSKEETDALMSKAHQAYDADVETLLLAALAKTFADWSGCRRIPVVKEGHGRAPDIENVDVLRTVGWFASTYPVLLELPETDEPAPCIDAIRKIMRDIPDKGFGYGILKYLTPGDVFSATDESSWIYFNYVSQFDEDEMGSCFSNASESRGEAISPLFKLPVFNVIGMVHKGRLTLTIKYASSQFREETARSLIETYRRELSKLTGCCLPRVESGE